jgi:lipopolysaccharide biosynthesis glycosyltransferase
MNRGYVTPSMVCINSILINNSTPIKFFILHSDLEEADINKMEEFVKKFGDEHELRGIKVSPDYFNDGPIHGRSKEAYFRMLIPYLLPKEEDRCLYLDGDTIVQGNLDKLYNKSFEGKALMACEDVGEILFFHKERHDLLGIPREFRYFNSGVLMINNEYFREHIKIEDIANYIKNNFEKLKFLDQDVLNALFYDKVKLVESNLYDYMEILVSHMLANDNMEKAVIVHFLKKPWRYTYNGVNAKYWWKYAKKMYPIKYLKFLILNFIFRKFLAILLLFISIDKVKTLKNNLNRK